MNISPSTGKLRPELDRIPGFLSIERSRELTGKRRVLSLSYWSDEAAAVAWRCHHGHHEAQVVGRNALFEDYRLRVGPVIRQWPSEAEYDQPLDRDKPLLVIVQTEERDADVIQKALGFVSPQVYESMVHPGRLFFLANLSDEGAACRVAERIIQSGLRATFQACEIKRDYGRFEQTRRRSIFAPIAQTQQLAPADPFGPCGSPEPVSLLRGFGGPQTDLLRRRFGCVDRIERQCRAGSINQ